MTAYALAHIKPQFPLHDEVFTYLEDIQATLDPYGGRFLVHGTTPEVKEGPLEGSYVLIAFPDRESAEAWYASPAYQKILPYRTDHMEGTAVILDGVPDDYSAANTAATLKALQQG